MAVAKSQISLFTSILMAVTTGVSFPVQAASLITVPSTDGNQQVQAKDTAFSSPQINTHYGLKFPKQSSSFATFELSQTITKFEAASQVTQETIGNKRVYAYNTNTTSKKNISKTTYYSNRWQLPQSTTQRKQVPESSPVIGLLFLMGFIIQKKLKSCQG